jgi:hypothetical protein
MRAMGVLGVVLVGVLGTGCLVEVHSTSDPGPAFKAARAAAARVQGRPGPAQELNLVAWDRHDRKLVRVSLPMWLCRKLDHEADWDDEDAERLARRVERHVRLRDLEHSGLGVVVEVEEDDGSQVLVWLR